MTEFINPLGLCQASTGQHDDLGEGGGVCVCVYNPYGGVEVTQCLHGVIQTCTTSHASLSHLELLQEIF